MKCAIDACECVEYDRNLCVQNIHHEFQLKWFTFFFSLAKTETPQANQIIECKICEKTHERLKSNHEISCRIQENIYIFLLFDV